MPLTQNRCEIAPTEATTDALDLGESSRGALVPPASSLSVQNQLPETKIYALLSRLSSQYMRINDFGMAFQESPNFLRSLTVELCRHGKLPFEIENLATEEASYEDSSRVRNQLSELLWPYISHLNFHPHGEVQPYMTKLLEAPALHTLLMPGDSHFLRDITGSNSIRRLSLIVHADSSVPRISAVVASLQALQALEIRCCTVGNCSCFFNGIGRVAVAVAEAFGRVRWLILNCSCSGSGRGYWTLVSNMSGPEILQLSKCPGQVATRVLRHPLALTMSGSIGIHAFPNFRDDVVRISYSRESAPSSVQNAQNAVLSGGTRILTLKISMATEFGLLDIFPLIGNISYLDLEWDTSEAFCEGGVGKKGDIELRENGHESLYQQLYSAPWSVLSETIRYAQRLEILHLSKILMKRNQLRIVLCSASTTLKVLVLHLTDVCNEENMFERIEYILDFVTDIHPHLLELRIEGFDLLNGASMSLIDSSASLGYIDRIRARLDRLKIERSDLYVEAWRPSLERYASKLFMASRGFQGF